MKFFPHSYNGFLFQQGTRVVSSYDDFDWDISGISTSNAQRTNNRPEYSGTVLGGAVKVVHITLNDVDRDRNALVSAMDVLGPNQIALYALDEFGKRWYCMAKCTGLNVEANDGNTAQYGYIFEIDDPTWIAVEELTDTWSITADEETHIVTVGGNQPTRPIFEITPQTSSGYFRYVQFVKNYNPIAYLQTDGIDITNGGWDTAALVSGGQMQVDGDDVRVIFDGAEIPFWVGGGGWNNAATKIFIRATWQPGQSMPLRTALAGTDIDELIEWELTDTVKAALGKLPSSGIILVGTEEISYQNLSVALCSAEIVERNIRGSVIAVHAIGAVCWWVEHDIRIIYGNSSATAPVYANTYKPVYDLTSSTNASRVYTVFADLANLRVGSWIRQVWNAGLGKLNRHYSGSHGAVAEVDPATEMGMEFSSYESNGYVRGDSAQLNWILYHPAGITTVTTTGEKFRTFSNTIWPGGADLDSSGNGTDWEVEWSEAATPPAANTWTALANNTTPESLAGYKPYVRYRFSGSINGIVDNFSRLEIQSVTIALTSANVIQVGLRGQLDNYQFSIELRNLSTGESLFVDYPVKLGETLIIDTDAMTAIYKGVNAIMGLSWDSIRTEWLQFKAGENNLQYFSNPTGTVDLVIKTHDRGL